MAWYWIVGGWIIAGACLGRLAGFTQKQGEYYIALVLWPLWVLLLIGEGIAQLIQKIAKKKE